MLVRKLHLRAVGFLLLRENTVEKAIALPLMDTADAVNIDEIGTEPDEDAARRKISDHRDHAFIRVFISRTASSMPVNSARLMMLCPMLSSCRCGIVRTSGMFT
jgi:hypothetical protein